MKTLNKTLALLFLLFVLACLCWLTLAWLDDAAARGAPAPLPQRRQPPRLDLAGRWLLDWGEQVYSVVMFNDGTWEARSQGVVWIGKWRLEGRTLSVEETLDRAWWCCWSVELDRRLSGLLCGDRRGLRIRLRKE